MGKPRAGTTDEQSNDRFTIVIIRPMQERALECITGWSMPTDTGSDRAREFAKSAFE